MSNSLDPDQDRHFVGPDLDPSCIQRLSGKCPTTEAGEELNIARELLYTDRLIVDNYCKIYYQYYPAPLILCQNTLIIQWSGVCGQIKHGQPKKLPADNICCNFHSNNSLTLHTGKNFSEFLFSADVFKFSSYHLINLQVQGHHPHQWAPLRGNCQLASCMHNRLASAH